MTNFTYINKPDNYGADKAYIVKIDPGISNRDELFKEYYSKCDFPGYFGFNWDALSDCLRDFSWISFDNIIIIHQAFPKMSEENNRIYFSILKDAVNDFKRDKVHKLSVIFPSSEKDKIEHFLKNN